jgi:hypothetical protein
LAIAIEHVDDAAGRDALGRALDHFLENPRMRRAALDL